MSDLMELARKVVSRKAGIALTGSIGRSESTENLAARARSEATLSSNESSSNIDVSMVIEAATCRPVFWESEYGRITGPASVSYVAKCREASGEHTPALRRI